MLTMLFYELHWLMVGMVAVMLFWGCQ